LRGGPDVLFKPTDVCFPGGIQTSRFKDGTTVLDPGCVKTSSLL
jgi:hypothetical protein